MIKSTFKAIEDFAGDRSKIFISVDFPSFNICSSNFQCGKKQMLEECGDAWLAAASAELRKKLAEYADEAIAEWEKQLKEQKDEE